MKLLLFAPICLLLACSSPRYLYHFPDPPGAAVTHPPAMRTEFMPTAPPTPVITPDAATVYSADVATPVATPPRRIHVIAEVSVVKRDDSATGTVKTKPSPAEEHLDGDLRRAVIFVVAGGILLLIGGQVFYVAGSLSLLIGLVFGIKWFIRR